MHSIVINKTLKFIIHIQFLEEAQDREREKNEALVQRGLEGRLRNYGMNMFL